MLDDNEIRLSLPPAGEHVQLARLVASGIASKLDFDYEEIEDLRLAVDELCFALLAADPAPGPLEIRYRVDADALAIEGRCTVANGAQPLRALPELTARILETVVDSYELGAADGVATFQLRKRRVPR